MSAVEGRERQLFCNDVLGAAIGDFVPPGEGLHTYICRGRTEEGRKSAERSSWHQVLSSGTVKTLARPCVHVMRLESQCPRPPAAGQSRSVLGLRWVRVSQVVAG